MSGDRPEESFAALFEKADPRASVPRRGARIGEVLEGTVVQVGRDAVFVELEGGRQGTIEAIDVRGPDGAIKAAVGDRMSVRVVRVDPQSGIQVVPTRDSAVAAGATVSVGGGPDGEAVDSTSAAQPRRAQDLRVAVGQAVSAVVDRVESYGLFLQVEGTKGRAGRGLAPLAELGVPRGADLRKAFPIGTKMKVKIIDLAEGKMRLSVRALKDDEERAEVEGFREKEKASAAPRGFGTIGDLIKARKT
jgi:small subunit ribosomal protein S1